MSRGGPINGGYLYVYISMLDLTKRSHVRQNSNKVCSNCAATLVVTLGGDLGFSAAVCKNLLRTPTKNYIMLNHPRMARFYWGPECHGCGL